jgi:hypothetical protein
MVRREKFKKIPLDVSEFKFYILFYHVWMVLFLSFHSLKQTYINEIFKYIK